VLTKLQEEALGSVIKFAPAPYNVFPVGIKKDVFLYDLIFFIIINFFGFEC